MARAHFGDLLDERSVRWGIENEYLAPLAWGQVEFKFSLDDVPTADTPGGMDYDPRVLQEVMKRNWPFVIDVVRKLYRSNQYDLVNRYSAAVCPGADEALEIAQALRAIGVDADCILGTTKDAERERLLKHKPQFRSSVFILREGWNDKRVEVAMMLRPMKSRVYYQQFLGRSLRPFGNKVALALDPHYQNTRFAPLSAPILFGQPGQNVISGNMLIGLRGSKTASPYIPADLSNIQPVLKVQPLEIEYWAGEDGFFTAGGEQWATIAAFTEQFSVTFVTLKPLLSSCRQRLGRSRGGKPETFYAVADIITAGGDRFVLPRANEEGIFEAEGAQWAPLNTLSNLLLVDNATLKKRLTAAKMRRGITRAGKVTSFYRIADAKQACTDLTKKIPQAGRDGTFRAEGEVWGTLESLARKLELNPKTVERRLPKNVPMREGRTPDGRLSIAFLPYSLAKRACADILEKKKSKKK